MRRWLIWLFQALVFIVPFAFSSLNDELFEFNKMLAVYIFAILILLVWSWRMISEKRKIFKPTPLFIPLLLYLISQIASTIFSMHVNTSVFGYYSRFHGGLLSTISYLILYFAAVSNLEKKDVRPLIRTALISAIVVALYAIPEHFGVSPSCVIITGQFSDGCWVQDVRTRVFATFGQPNWLAAYFLMLMPLTMWFLLDKAKPTLLKEKSSSLLKKYWPLAAIVLMSYATYYTGSRSGFLALALEVAMVLGFGSLQYYLAKKNDRPSPWLILAIVVPLVVALFTGTPYTPSVFKEAQKIGAHFQARNSPASSAPVPDNTPTPSSGGTTVLENGGTESSTIRWIVWSGALAVWKRYPIFGSGLETFAYSYYGDRPVAHNNVSEWDFLYNKAHNEFLNTLATAGIVGLMTLLLLMGSFVCLIGRDILHAIKQKRWEDGWLYVGLLAGYLGLAVTNFFGFSTVMVAVFFLLFPALWYLWRYDVTQVDDHSANATALVRPAKSYVARQGDDLELNINGEAFGKGLLSLIALYLIFVVASMWNNDRLLAEAKAHRTGGDPQGAVALLQTITKRAPHEAVFWDEESLTFAQMSLNTSSGKSQDATLSAQFAQAAIHASDEAVRLNPVQVNYWKSRARVYLVLSNFDRKQLTGALQALAKARLLAPTDAKITYNVALIYQSMGQNEAADEYFRTTLDLRAGYEEAHKAYGQFLEQQKRYPEAIDQFKYLTEKLNPGDNETRAHWQQLEASVSAKRL